MRWLLVFFLLPGLMAQPSQRPKRTPPLTSKQVVDLISLGAPDKVIAGEIEARGLSFEPTFEFLDGLSTKGAGTLTINALAARTPHPALTVKCVPGAQVEITLGGMDSTNRAVVDEKGEVMFPGLRPGTLKLRVTKDKYVPVERTVTLAGAGTVTETVVLLPLMGQLSITVDPPESTVEILGKSYRAGDPIQVELPAGIYPVVAKSEGHVAESRDLPVVAGETQKIEFSLRVDPSAAGLLTRRASGLLQRGEGRKALALVEKILAVAPEQVEPMEVGALALWGLGREKESVQMTARSIRAGATLSFELTHHHFDNLHPVRMTLSRAGIEFDDRGDRRCGIDEDSLPLEAGRVAQVVISPDGEVLLRLQGVRPDNPKRKFTFNFTGIGCQYVKERRNKAGGMLQIVVNVIRCDQPPLPHLKRVAAVLAAASGVD